MALENATRELLTKMASAGKKPIYELTPTEARKSGIVLREMYGAGPEMDAVRDVNITGLDGETFEARVLIPSTQPEAVLVYYHGGGWVVGHIDEFDTLGRQLAKAMNVTVVLVNYRKAPEHRFPGPVEDAWSALQWTDQELESIAGRRVPLLIGGDSAGGTLAAVMAIRARDRSGPEVALQILVYPVTDSDFGTPSYIDPENQLMLDRRAMEWFWFHYIPRSEDRRHPEASPLKTADLGSLPPAVIITAEHDVLRDEGEAYAHALAAAGNTVQLQRFDGQMHGFFTMVNVLPGSAAAQDFIAQAAHEFLTQGVQA